jgi:hypothetical protein
MKQNTGKVLMLVLVLLLFHSAAFAIVPHYNLSVNKTGTGDGTVAGGGSYSEYATAHPTATADGYSAFSIWSGDCSGTASPTSVYMDRDKTCTATFTCNYDPYRIGGTRQPYDNIQAAYNSTPHNETLDLQALTFSGDLLIDQEKTVVITGGYTCAFVSDTGLSTINTKIVISDGKAIVANIIIK